MFDVGRTGAHGDDSRGVREGCFGDGGGEGFGGFCGANKTPTKVGGREAVGFEGEWDANHVGEGVAELVDEILVSAVVFSAGFTEDSLDEEKSKRLVEWSGALGTGHVREHLADLDDAGRIEDVVVAADTTVELVVGLFVDHFLDFLSEFSNGLASVRLGQLPDLLVRMLMLILLTDLLLLLLFLLRSEFVVREHASDSMETETVSFPHFTGSFCSVLVDGGVDLGGLRRFGGHGRKLLLIDDGVTLSKFTRRAVTRTSSMRVVSVNSRRLLVWSR